MQTIFARIDRPVLTVFTQRNLVADFLQVKFTFWRKTTILHFSVLRGNIHNWS